MSKTHAISQALFLWWAVSEGPLDTPGRQRDKVTEIQSYFFTNVVLKSKEYA